MPPENRKPLFSGIEKGTSFLYFSFLIYLLYLESGFLIRSLPCYFFLQVFNIFYEVFFSIFLPVAWNELTCTLVISFHSHLN